MQKIIAGKLYDTETAERVCDISGEAGTNPRHDIYWAETWLYKSPKGTFFVAGEGGARSRWKRQQHETTVPGEGLQVVSVEEARDLCEQFGNHENYLKVFGQPEEG
jgi:hypothetical protein